MNQSKATIRPWTHINPADEYAYAGLECLVRAKSGATVEGRIVRVFDGGARALIAINGDRYKCPAERISMPENVFLFCLQCHEPMAGHPADGPCYETDSSQGESIHA